MATQRLNSHEPAFTVEHKFLGTSWSFVTWQNGDSYWFNTKTLNRIESSRVGAVKDGE
jgi:hypothetical protein